MFNYQLNIRVMIKKLVHNFHRTQKTTYELSSNEHLITDDEKASTISGTVKLYDIDFSSC